MKKKKKIELQSCVLFVNLGPFLRPANAQAVPNESPNTKKAESAVTHIEERRKRTAYAVALLPGID